MSLRWIKKGRPVSKQLVIFVHGFTGGKDTFVNASGQHLFRLIGPEGAAGFDCCEFVYTTHGVLVEGIRKWVRFIPFIGKHLPYRGNARIHGCSKMLKTEYGCLIDEYEQIHLVCHSMGGLIAKRLITDLDRDRKPHKGCFITMASPHRGIEVPSIARRLNVQADDIQLHSQFIAELERDWAKLKSKVNGWYLVAGHDQIISENSAHPGDDNSRVFHIDSDHIDICKPINRDAAVPRLLRKILFGNQTSVSLAAKNRSNDALFVSYQPTVKPYYLQREIDARSAKDIATRNVWLFGVSGFGKTNANQFLLTSQVAKRVYIDFSPFGDSSTVEEIAQGACDSIAIQVGAHNHVHSDLKNIPAIISKITEVIAGLAVDSIVISFDEIALSAEDKVSAVIDFLIRLGRVLIKSPGGKSIRLIVSTLGSPLALLSGGQRDQFIELFTVSEVKPWSEEEIRKLSRIIVDACDSDVSIDIEDSIVAVANGSPRRLKNFFCYLLGNYTIPFEDTVVSSALVQYQADL